MPIRITGVQALQKNISGEKYVMQTNIFLHVPKKTKPEEREAFEELLTEMGSDLEEAIKAVLIKNRLLEE